MVPTMPKDHHIAIVGAGIGGLAAAALLAQSGYRISIFDQFPAPRPLGSGLVIQPVGQAVLDLCGAGAAARDLGTPIRRMTGHEVAQHRLVLDVSYDRPQGPRYGLAIHRAALFQALLDAARRQGAQLLTGSRIIAAPPHGAGRGLKDDHGQLHGPFDLVVDAAGAGSPLSPLVARPLPYGAVWGTVPWPEASPLPRDALRQCYRRASQMAGVLPLGRIMVGGPALAAIFWSLPRPALDRWPEIDIAAWKAEVTALWPDMAPFLAPILAATDMTPARYAHGTLRRPHAPGLVHIGDSAHRASPQLGQGANMALLDALALARALAHAPHDPGPAYARMRRWHVRLYQALSAAFTPQYQSDSRVLPLLRDRVLMPVSRLWPVPRILTALVGGDLIPPLAGMDFPPRPRHTADKAAKRSDP
jgi:2-polyprenyl-6-methoxyphenol hydroxylase-like FAD-dependent oxidoreductase